MALRCYTKSPELTVLVQYKLSDVSACKCNHDQLTQFNLVESSINKEAQRVVEIGFGKWCGGR